MSITHKNKIIIVAAVLVLAFFMPWLKYFLSLSGWDMVFGSLSSVIDSGLKILVILIPVSAGIILYGAAYNNENYPISKNILFRVPLVTIIITTLVIMTNMDSLGAGFGDLLSLLSIGYWLTLIGSILLPYLRTEPVINAEQSSMHQTTQPIQTVAEPTISQPVVEAVPTTSLQPDDNTSQEVPPEKEE